MDLSTWILLGIILILILHYFDEFDPPNYPPGPPKIPIIGTNGMNLHKTLYKARPIISHIFTEWAHKYGEIFSVKAGILRAVIISSHDLAREVLAKEEWAYRPHTAFIQMYMKHKESGIFFSNGKQTKIRRNFCLKKLKEFGFGNKASMEASILEELKALGDSFNDSTKGNENSFREGEVGHRLEESVVNVLWRIMASKKPDDNIFDTLVRVSEYLTNSTFVLITVMFPFLAKIYPSTVYARAGKEFDRLRGIMQRIIDEHRETWVEGEPRDFIDACFDEKKRLEKFEDNHLEIYDDDQIGCTMVDLFLAGIETTPLTLRWFFLYMIEYPETQQRIQEEIDTVIGKDRLPSIEDRSRMPYTQATIWEVMRHATPSFLRGARINFDTAKLGKYTIPKGTLLLTNAHAIHRDPKTFVNPEIFNPLRFMTANGELDKNPKIMPFLAGKRQCVAEPLVWMFLFFQATYLLQRFSFSKIPGAKYTLLPKAWDFSLDVPRDYRLRIKTREICNNSTQY